MKTKMKVTAVATRDGLMEDLRDPEFAAEYIKACLHEGGEGAFLKALRNVAEAWGGLGQIAKDTNLNRQGLYKMLDERGNPSYESILALLARFGLRLSVEPVEKKKPRKQVTRREVAR